MNISIRSMIFETNSSGTHAFSIIDSTLWDRFLAGDARISFDETNETIVEMSEQEYERIKERCKDTPYFDADDARDMLGYNAIGSIECFSEPNSEGWRHGDGNGFSDYDIRETKRENGKSTIEWETR